MQRDTFFAKEMELVLEDRSVSAFRGFTIQTERCMAKVASFARAWLDWQRLQCYARTWNVVRDRLTCGDRGITEWLEFFWDPFITNYSPSAFICQMPADALHCVRWLSRQLADRGPQAPRPSPGQPHSLGRQVSPLARCLENALR